MIELMHLWETVYIQADRAKEAEKYAEQIKLNRDTYEVLENKSGVPWYVIACIHHMESGCRFDRHLHNGDPLLQKTIHVPKGRPLEGDGPFSFEESALDALEYDGFMDFKDWSIAKTLDRLERYNGLGYRKRGINSPYLWAGTNHYIKGLFVSDGRFDPEKISNQIGCAAIWKFLEPL